MILGSFYLRQSDTGNLIGEFYNNTMDRVRSESADMKIESSIAFTGTYSSTWFDEGAQSLDLEITTDNNTIYNLRWFDDIRDVFVGRGFLSNGLLIGTYWDDEMQPNIPT
jgi:hypothetical protein